MRLVARFAALLLILPVLSDLTGRVAVCFDPARPFVPESVPFCFLLSLAMLDEGLDGGGLTGLLWHYLPTTVVALSIAVAWPLKDRWWKPT